MSERSFEGRLVLDAPLSPEQVEYINKFGNTRRMTRQEDVAATMSDPVREAVGLPVGREGAYFTGGVGHKGQDRDPSVVHVNDPPDGQPGNWCDWRVTDGGTALVVADEPWRAFDAREWLRYLIAHFLIPWGRRIVSGEVVESEQEWQEVDSISADDMGFGQ